jgi:hypothetical protein
MEGWNNVIKEARTGTICRSVSLLVTPPFHQPIIPLARLSSLLIVPSFYHSLIPIFPLEKYSFSRQWLSLFPALYFLFPFLPDYSTPLPLSTSSPSRVVLKNMPGLSGHELKRQVVYKEPRFRYFFNLYVQRAANKQTDISRSTFTPAAIVFKYLQHIRTIQEAVPGLEFIRSEASPLRPRPPGGIPGPIGKPTPLSLIFPALFFPTDIHSRGHTHTYTYTAASQGSQPGPKPQTPSIYPGKQLHLRDPSLKAPAMFVHAYPAAGPPASLPGSLQWNRPRLKSTSIRPRQSQQHPLHQYHRHRQVFTFTHPAELFHKLRPLSLPTPTHRQGDQKVAAAPRDLKAPTGSPESLLMSTGMRIPISLARTFSLRPPGQFSSPRVSSFSSFLSLFHYHRDTGTIHEKSHHSIVMRRKIATQTIDIKNTVQENRFFSSREQKQEMKHLREVREGDKAGEVLSKQPLTQSLASSLRLPLQYLNPWKIVSEALGKPDTHGTRHFGPGTSAGPVDYGHQDGKGHKRSPYGSYDTHDMQHAPGGSRMSSKTDIDLNQLTNRVYDMLERKIKNEKERRGW